MSNERPYNPALFIALIISVFVSEGLSCGFRCDSGQCIDSDELCDGVKNCQDGSDETPRSCIHQRCPTFSFRCVYGACVSGKAKCNGRGDCADGSDEVGCGGDDNKISNPNCLSDQYGCKSGECISEDKLCDGRADCRDHSDETVQKCAAIHCPSYAFQCGYGACIQKTKKCDGKEDCDDGSDEVPNLCSSAPSPPTDISVPVTQIIPVERPTPKPPREPTSGCVVPDIPNAVLTYASDQTRVLQAGDIVPEEVSTNYKCRPGYNRLGSRSNYCLNGKWDNPFHIECLKFCPPHVITGVTFNAECKFDGTVVPCNDRIRPSTIARLTCSEKYRPTNSEVSSVIMICSSDGEWKSGPIQCSQICGEELIKVTPFITFGDDTNITFVPWHAAVYQKISDNYTQICGASIISAKVLLSAAHCFFRKSSYIPYDKSEFAVGAGKYYRDYYKFEPNAVFSNISEIITPSKFKGNIENIEFDLAVLVLTNFLRFSSYIAPVCIDWKSGGAKAISSGTFGLIVGWGLDEDGEASTVLRTGSVEASSYYDCRKALGPELEITIPSDKFCSLNTNNQIACRGDSGGGFTEKLKVNGRNIYYLWGLVSGGIPAGNVCREYEAMSMTNIHEYQDVVVGALARHIPR